MTPGRIPPHNIESEEQLLSACFLDGIEVITRAINGGVSPASFYAPANQVIFGLMLEQFTTGEAFDVAAIGVLLGQRKQLAEIGGYGYLARVSDRVATTANTGFFIQRVVELAQVRDAIRAATGIVESCYSYTGGSPREHLAQDVDRLHNALAGSAQSRKWADAVKEAKAAAMERMKPLAQRTANTWAVSWPWLDLEKCFLPVEPGELVIIAARPSVGKSSLARQIAWAAAANGLPTLFHTLEVTDAELATNLAANISGIRSRRDLDKLHEKDKAELLASFDALAAPTAAFSAIGEDDTVLAMIARANAFKQKNGLRLWVVDYLGLVADCQNNRQGETTAAAIGRVTRTLKRFATAQSVPVILLCQLNRGADVSEGVPKLSNLRDSGRIEEDANRVLLLHRPTTYEVRGQKFTQDPNSSPADERTHYIEVIMAKGRNTGTATVALSFDRPTATFKNFIAQ